MKTCTHTGPLRTGLGTLVLDEQYYEDNLKEKDTNYVISVNMNCKVFWAQGRERENVMESVCFKSCSTRPSSGESYITHNIFQKKGQSGHVLS